MSVTAPIVTTTHATITIDQPPGRVFHYLTNFANLPRWMAAIVAVEAPSGCASVGTPVTLRYGVRSVARFAVAIYASPALCILQALDPCHPRTISWHLMVHNDATLLRYGWQPAPDAPLALFGAADTAAEMQTQLARLKALLEVSQQVIA